MTELEIREMAAADVVNANPPGFDIDYPAAVQLNGCTCIIKRMNAFIQTNWRF